MPNHILFLCLHAAIGFLIAIGFTAAIYITDFGGFRQMIDGSPSGQIALLVFTILNGATFAAAQVGIRVMLMDDDDT